MSSGGIRHAVPVNVSISSGEGEFMGQASVGTERCLPLLGQFLYNVVFSECTSTAGCILKSNRVTIQRDLHGVVLMVDSNIGNIYIYSNIYKEKARKLI